MVPTMNFLVVERFPLPILTLLGPDIRLRISNALSLHSSLNARCHISQPYRTTGNIVLEILILKFFEGNQEYKSVWAE